MTSHRLHLVFAACLGALMLTSALFGLAEAASVLPAPAQSSLHEEVYGPQRVVSNTLSFDYASELVTLAARPDFLALAAFSQAGDPKVIWSADGGKSWWPLPLPPGLSYPTTLGLAPRADANQPVRFLVGGHLESNGLPVDRLTLYRSGDFGVTWAESFSRTGESTQICNMNLQMGQAQPGSLYLHTGCTYLPLSLPQSPDDEDGLYVSADGGVSWRQLTDAYYVTPSPAKPGRLYQNFSPVVWSDDNGFNWKSFPTTWYMDEAILDRSEPDTLYAYQVIYGTISNTTQVDLVQKTSFDNGATWRDWASSPCEQLDAGVPTSYAGLVSVGRHQLWTRCDSAVDPPRIGGTWYFSDDAGDRWAAKEARGAFLRVDYGHAGHALMLNEQGLWRSVDGGDWVLVTADFSAPPLQYTYLPNILR